MAQKSLVSMLIFIMAITVACNPASPEIEATDESNNEPQPTINSYEGRRIAVVDSYHEGYEWSDELVAGVDSVLVDSGAETLLIRMDTKVNTDQEFRENVSASAHTQITEFNPEVIIACDDNAQEYLIVPYFMDSDIPIIFCGVNWDASVYDYPNEHITGMVEVELMDELTSYLETFAGGSNIAVITGDASTEHKVHDYYNDNFFDGSLSTYFVTTWEEFQTTYIEMQQAHDYVIIRNNSAISDWPEDEVAIQFIQENTTVPTGAFNPWMAPYVLIVIGKSSFEQGEWSATTALSILDGTSISDIPVTTNRQGNLILNLDVAEQLDIEFSPALLRNAEIYPPTED